jgi:hypothetical protein
MLPIAHCLKRRCVWSIAKDADGVKGVASTAENDELSRERRQLRRCSRRKLPLFSYKIGFVCGEPRPLTDIER